MVITIGDVSSVLKGGCSSLRTTCGTRMLDELEGFASRSWTRRGARVWRLRLDTSMRRQFVCRAAVAGHDRPGGHPSHAAIQFERNRFAARIAVCLFTFVQIIDLATT